VGGIRESNKEQEDEEEKKHGAGRRGTHRQRPQA
jgi:hypothetical protein